MKKAVIRNMILAVSIVMIGVGVYRQETDTVFRKAINICMECIGIG